MVSLPEWIKKIIPLVFIAGGWMLLTAHATHAESTIFEEPFKTVRGDPVKISDFKGKIVLVNFWATWCPPCRDEIPDLVRFQREYADNGFTVLGVDILERVDRETLLDFMEEFKMNYPVILDEPERTMDLAKALGGLFGLPRSFLLDRNGAVVESYTGALNEKLFKNMVEPLL